MASRSREIKSCLRLCLGLHLVAFWPAVASAGEPADAILQRTGVKAGICSIPASQGLDLPRAIAKASRMRIHIMHPKRPQVQAWKAELYDEGLLGRRIYAEAGSPEKIPFANNYVDLLVIQEGMAQTPDQAREIARVLSPFRGTAVVTDKGVAAKWKKLLTEAGLTPAKGESAILAMKKPALKGSSDWSHKYHNPGNNPCSPDKALQWPFMSQWWGKPYHQGFFNGTYLAAGGRIFHLNRNGKYGITDDFSAWSSYNGMHLWTRKLPPLFETGSSLAIALPNVLYMGVMNRILRIDPETGKDRSAITLEAFKGMQIKWMGLDKGILLCLLGTPDSKDSSFAAPIRGKTKAAEQGRMLAAVSVDSGRVLWSSKTKGGALPKWRIGLSKGRLFTAVPGAGVFAFDIQNGEELWTNEDPVLKNLKGGRPMGGHFGLMATENHVVLCFHRTKKTIALNAHTGKVTWQADGRRDGRVSTALLIGDVLIAKGGGRHDLASGKALARIPWSPQGCGVITGTEDFLFSMVSQVHYREKRLNLKTMVKSPCDGGSFAANGLMISPPGGCHCDMPMLGFRVLGSSNGFQLNRKADPSTRLYRDAGVARAVKPLDATNADWPCFRANTKRSGSSKASVGKNVKQLWHRKPAHPFLYWKKHGAEFASAATDWSRRKPPDFQMTPAVAVGSSTLFGTSEGLVECLDTANGKTRWRYFADGGITRPPSIAEGMVYVPSADGCLHALDLQTGRLVWRFQAAPGKRRIMKYGHLSSTWPLVAGAIAHAGVVYLVAGYDAINGVHAYALKARTGELIWQNNHVGGHGSDVLGNMTVGRDRLWVRGGKNGKIALHLQSGKFDRKISPGGHGAGKWGKVKIGQYSGFFRDRYLIAGGLRDLSYEFLIKPSRATVHRFSLIEADGVMVHPPRTIMRESFLAPCWNDDIVLMIGRADAQQRGRFPACRISAFDAGKTTAYLDKEFSTREKAFGWKTVSNLGPKWKKAADCHLVRWSRQDMEVCDAILCADGPVVVSRHLKWGNPSRFALAKRKIALLDPKTGKTVWEHPLPGDPTLSATCIDRNGRIIVPLIDGGIVCYGK